jgi:MFS family permease
MFSRALRSVAVLPSDVPVAERALAPSQVRRGLLLSIGEGMMAQVHITLTAGAFLTGYALMLGAGNVTVGIVAALPFLIQPLQLFGAWLIERQGARKPLAVGGSLGRSLWLILLVLPYLPLSTTHRLIALIATLTVANALLTLCGNAWLNWMTDLVPPRLRGRYFGTRSSAMAVIAMAANFGGGLWLDRMRAADRAVDGYTAILSVAILCGAGASLLLSRQPEPPLVQNQRLPIREVVRRPLRHPTFRSFMIGLMVWHAALGMATPFFSAHALTVLHLSFQTLAMFDVITAAVSIGTVGLWGQLADRVGHRRVLLMCIAGVILLPWCWVLATPTALWPLYVNAVLSGIWWSGLNLALSNRLMEQVPTAGRGGYLAVFAASTGLTFFLASMLSGNLANVLAGVSLDVGWLSLNNYQIIFVVSSMLRLSTLVFWRKAL